MTVDYEYVSSLLNIAEKCTGHSGKLSNLQSHAIGELMRINAEIKDEAVEKAKVEGAERAKKDAEAKALAESENKATGLPDEPGREPEPEREIFTSDTPNPNLERRV